MAEKDLILAIAAGDERALRELYALYYPRLVRFLLRLTRDEGLIGEAINDTFLVVWQKAGSFRGDSSLSTWIIGISYKKTLKALKRIHSHEPLAVIDDFPAEESKTDEVINAIGKLSPKHRAVLVLTYEFGYSYREIGEILSCPENTVKTRMHYARKALRHLMETQ